MNQGITVAVSVRISIGCVDNVSHGDAFDSFVRYLLAEGNRDAGDPQRKVQQAVLDARLTPFENGEVARNSSL